MPSQAFLFLLFFKGNEETDGVFFYKSQIKRKEKKNTPPKSHSCGSKSYSFQKQISDPAGPTLAPKDSEFHER